MVLKVGGRWKSAKGIGAERPEQNFRHPDFPGYARSETCVDATIRFDVVQQDASGGSRASPAGVRFFPSVPALLGRRPYGRHRTRAAYCVRIAEAVNRALFIIFPSCTPIGVLP